MALIAGNWYTITFSSLTDPPWTPPLPDVSGKVIETAIGSGSLLVYCVDDAVPGDRYEIAWHGGRGIIPAGVEVVTASPTKYVLTDDDGEATVYAHDDDGSLLWYGPQGQVKRLTAPGAFKTFI